MTKKDYQLIASVLKADIEFIEGYDKEFRAIRSVALDMADALEKQDNNFKRDLFLKDCGIENISDYCKSGQHSHCYHCDCACHN